MVDPIYVMSLGMVGVVLAVVLMLFFMYKMWKTLEHIRLGTEGIRDNTGRLHALGHSQPVQYENQRMSNIDELLKELAQIDAVLQPRRAQQIVSRLAQQASKLQDEMEDAGVGYAPTQYAPRVGR